jgi:hypothetical protein
MKEAISSLGTLSLQKMVTNTSVLTNWQNINEVPFVIDAISFILIKTNQTQLCSLIIDLRSLDRESLTWGIFHVWVSVCVNETICTNTIQRLFVKLLSIYIQPVIQKGTQMYIDCSIVG